jgi:hypothetical protein
MATPKHADLKEGLRKRRMGQLMELSAIYRPILTASVFQPRG